jgi:hypothetical protein
MSKIAALALALFANDPLKAMWPCSLAVVSL